MARTNYYDRIAEMPRTKLDRNPINTSSDATAYGRTAAALGWTEADIRESVAPTFHTVAIAAFNARKASLLRKVRGEVF